VLNKRNICVLALGLIAGLSAFGQQSSALPAGVVPGKLPDAPSTSMLPKTTRQKFNPTLGGPYFPLTGREKFNRWARNTVSPYTFATVLMSAAWSETWDDWPTYGGGMDGFGKRFGATLADTEAGLFFKSFLLPTVLHQDPRYFAMRTGGILPRIWYAGTRVLVTRNDQGENTFNTSEVAGTLFARSLTNAYYPRRERGFSETMTATWGALLSDAGTNVLREFSPDILRVFRRHEPERLKKLEEKIPEPIHKMGTMGSE
jgi:hypothetical protein